MRERKVVVIGLMIVILSCLISLLMMFPYFNNGDASIYLTFAKSMKNGLFYYGYEGPKGGATSPLWAALLSLVYFFSENTHLNIIFYKILSVLFFLLSVGILYRFSNALFENEKRKDRKVISLMVLCVYLFNPMLRYFAITIFETSLAMVFSISFLFIVYLFLEDFTLSRLCYSKTLLLGVLSGLFLLVRPDSLILIGGSFLYFFVLEFLYRKRNIINDAKIYALSAILIVSFGLPYYIFLSLNQKCCSIIPNTLIARPISHYLMSIHMFGKGIRRLLGIFSHLNSNLEAYPFLLIFLFSTGVFLYMYKKGLLKKRIWILLYGISLAYVLYFIYSYPFQQFDRYVLLVYPYVSILSGYGLFLLASHIKGRIFQILFLAFIVIIAAVNIYMPTLIPKFSTVQGFGSSEDVMFKKRADYINRIADPSDRVLLFEIQMQYYLDIQALSVDGIVGGEIIPYLKDGDIARFIKEYNITLTTDVTGAYELPQFANTVLGELGKVGLRLSTGETFITKGIKFIKIMTPSPDESLAPGDSGVFRVEVLQ